MSRQLIPTAFFVALAALSSSVVVAESSEITIYSRFVDARAGDHDILTAPSITTITGQEAVIHVHRSLSVSLPELPDHAQALEEGVSLRVRPILVDGSVLLAGTVTVSDPAKPAEVSYSQDQVSGTVRNTETAFVLRAQPGDTSVLSITAGVTVELRVEVVSLANAAAVYWQAFAQLPAAPGDDDAAALAAWIAQAGPALDLLHSASTSPHCNWELDYSQGFSLVLPHLSKMRTLVKAAVARADATMQDTPSQAHADLRAALRAARHLGADPILIHQLVRIALEKQVYTALTHALPDSQDRELNAWSSLLTSQPTMPTTAVIVEAERTLMFTSVNSQLTLANDAERAEILRQWGLDPATSVSEVEKMVEIADADYRELEGIAGLPPADRPGAFAAFEQKLVDERPPNSLSRMLIPAIGKADKKLQKAEEDAEAMRQKVEQHRRHRQRE